MQIHKTRRLTVRTIVGTDPTYRDATAAVVARFKIEGTGRRPDVSEDLTAHEAIVLASSLFGFGLSQKPGFEVGAFTADMLAIMAKHGLPRPDLEWKETDGD